MKRWIAKAWDRYRRTPRGLRWIVVAALLIAFAWVFEDVRGRLALKSLHRKAEAMGVVLDWEKLKPKTAPAPEDDLLAAPIFAEWLEASPGDRERTRLAQLDLLKITGMPVFGGANRKLRRGDAGVGWAPPIGTILSPPGAYGGDDAKILLVELEPFESDLRELADSARRPNCRLIGMEFDMELREGASFLNVILDAAKIFKWRARAHAQLGAAELALEDILTILKLGGHLEKPERLALGTMVARTIHAMAQDSTFYGLKHQIWTDAQLLVLESELRKHDLAAMFPRVAQYEQAWSEAMFKYMVKYRLDELLDPYKTLEPIGFTDNRTFWEKTKDRSIALGLKCLPTGCYHQNIRHREKVALETIIAPRGRLSTRLIVADIDALRDALADPSSSPYALGVVEFLNVNIKMGERILGHQTGQDLMLVAIALERFRIAKGAYPKSLARLVPDFLPTVPIDRFEIGNVVRYARTPNGRYKIWASNVDRDDDGGGPGKAWDEEDAVWQYQPMPTP